MLVPVIGLIVSTVILALSSKVAIESGSEVARYFGMKESAIGFLFIAVFTSLPELFVGIFSGGVGHPNISLGNVIGSNIADVLLVLGASILFAVKAKINKKKLIEQVDIVFLISLIPILIILRGTLGRVDGLILLVLFVIYSIFVLRTSIKAGIRKRKEYSMISWTWLVIKFWGSLDLLVISSYYTVDSTVKVANMVGIPEEVIAMSIIALGTSLPELAVGIASVMKKHVDIAVGDVLGSCVTNITLVLGATLLVSPVNVEVSNFLFSISVLMTTNLGLWYLMVKRKELGRGVGLFMVLAYITFIMLEFLVRR